MEFSEFKSHLNKLVLHFQDPRKIGCPSAMIGSGFSRNADPVSQSTPPMPDWKGLIAPFFEQLEPDARYQGEDPLSVFQQFEDRFGRSYLDKQLKDVAPWRDYR